MTDYVYSGDRELADMYFSQKRYSEAKCQYVECLNKTKMYQPNHKQLIEYLERKIKECKEKI